MTDTKVYQKLRSVLIDSLQVPKESINIAVKLKADLGADSIDTFDIVVKLENMFGIDLPYEELFPKNSFEFITVGMIHRYLCKKIKAVIIKKSST